MLEINDKEFRKLVAYVKNNLGINLVNKRKLIEGRLGSYIQEKGYQSFAEYIDSVLNDISGIEITNLVNKLTTNHTFFMREENHFKYLRDIVLPEIVDKARQKDICIWSAGCSTGEEPYTIAMLLQDYFGLQKSLWDTRVLATDISAKVLDAAKKGIYSPEALALLPCHWKSKYFKKIDEYNYEICNQIKNEVIFRSFNLMQDVFPFKKRFHVIFCRNVMIYFENETKMELIKRFYEVTEKGGYLFIGHSESIAKEESCYRYIKPAIYRKL